MVLCVFVVHVCAWCNVRCMCYMHTIKKINSHPKVSKLAYLSKFVYCGPAKKGTHVAAAKVTVLVQGDVHQGWPETSCILSGQAAKL